MQGWNMYLMMICILGRSILLGSGQMCLALNVQSAMLPSPDTKTCTSLRTCKLNIPSFNGAATACYHCVSTPLSESENMHAVALVRWPQLHEAGAGPLSLIIRTSTGNSHPWFASWCTSLQCMSRTWCVSVALTNMALSMD